MSGLSLFDPQVDAVFDGIRESLKTGESVEIRGFGTWSQTVRKSRSARNPKTGAAVQVPEKKGVHFKPGLELRRRVDS